MGSQSGWSSVFQVESKMIHSVAGASETRFLQLTIWSTIVLLLYSVMWVFLAEGKCDMQLVQTYNAIGVSALSIGGLIIGVLQLNGTREAFRLAYELKTTALLHILFAVPQLAAFCLFTIDIVSSNISAIAYVTYASIGVVWPIGTACVQLYFPLALQQRFEHASTTRRIVRCPLHIWTSSSARSSGSSGRRSRLSAPCHQSCCALRRVSCTTSSSATVQCSMSGSTRIWCSRAAGTCTRSK